jgi:hypothetical protein
MDPRITELTKGIEKVVGASDNALDDLSRALGVGLPGDYVELLKLTNGGEGFVGEVSYLMLWPVEEILERNKKLEADNKLVLFASNGGDAAFAFDRSSPGMPIVEIPYLDMDEQSAAQPRGNTLREFLEYLNAQV